MQKIKTILHIIDALNYGGAQNLLVLLARWTPKDRYRMVVSTLQCNLEMRGQIEANGVRVYALNRPRPSIFHPHRLARYVYRNIRDIQAICKRESIDIVHCHLSDAELFGIPAARLSGIRRIFSTVHYPDLLPARPRGDLRNMLRILMTRIIYQWVSQVIAVSEDVDKKLEKAFGLQPKRRRLIVNGIDVDSFSGSFPDLELKMSLGLSPTQTVVTSVGRLMPPKGHSYLIDAAAILISRYENLRFILVGDGDLKASLMARARQRKIEENFLFLGSRPDVDRLLAISDIFILPSLWEGTSLALLEAMAARKAIVCTDIPGNDGLMEHCINCYKVPPGDSAGLAEGVSFFLENPVDAARFSDLAYQRVKERYDIRHTISQLESVWR